MSSYLNYIFNRFINSKIKLFLIKFIKKLLMKVNLKKQFEIFYNFFSRYFILKFLTYETQFCKKNKIKIFIEKVFL